MTPGVYIGPPIGYGLGGFFGFYGGMWSISEYMPPTVYSEQHVAADTRLFETGGYTLVWSASTTTTPSGGSVASLFEQVTRDLGAPRLVVHNIDGRVPGIFRKGIIEADPALALDTLRNAAFSAFLVGQQAARLMQANVPDANGAKGTIVFTNASAALKGFPASGAFAMACQAKTGLAQSMARELMPQGIHVVNVPIDAAVGWRQEDGSRAHRLAGTATDDNMADPDCIAETYLQLHRQHRSTWAFEVVLRPWNEKW